MAYMNSTIPDITSERVSGRARLSRSRLRRRYIRQPFIPAESRRVLRAAVNPYRKKPLEREKAIALRKLGLSYNEIRREVGVSKSTLSLWLRSVGLAKPQKQRITCLRRWASKKGQLAIRKKRVTRMESIIANATKDVSSISQRELWLIGIALYWAEGHKPKSYNLHQVVRFGNSDPRMIRIFLKWLIQCCGVQWQDLKFRIYIHESADVLEAKRYWKDVIDHDMIFSKTVLKGHRPTTNRHNRFTNYHGLLDITVKRSTDFNRKITGWTNGIINGA